jgi:hypothetical protein
LKNNKFLTIKIKFQGGKSGMNRNIVMRRVIILIMSVGLLIGCGEIYAKKVIAANSDNGSAITAKELKNINKSKEVTMVDDSCAAIIWIPKDQKTALYKITSYLKNTKLYKNKIPKSKVLGTYHVNANINPSTLHIIIDKNNEIVIQPAFYADDKGGTFKIHYIDNVLSMTKNNKKIYIKDNSL